MDTYITRSEQNIFDLAVTLSGSIDGINDLLMNNYSLAITSYGPQELEGKPLSYDTVLKRGVIINYHSGFKVNEDIASLVSDNGIIIANSHNADPYIDTVLGSPIYMIKQTGKTAVLSGHLYSGDLYIDWGDDAAIKQVSGTDNFEIEHVYRTNTSHTIKIYGNFSPDNIDFSGIKGTVYDIGLLSRYFRVDIHKYGDLNHVIR